MSASAWYEPVELVGPTLRLRPFTLEDAPALLAATAGAGSAEVFQHLRTVPPADLTDAIDEIRQMLDDPDRIAYGQWIEATGQLVGSTSFYEISPTWRSLTIGHTWLARPYWRTGVNTESKLLMLARAFDGLGAERVVWHTDIRNVRSQRAIERLGATREGVLRHHRIRRDGSWRDTVQYAMIAADWPAARDRLGAALQQSRGGGDDRDPDGHA